MLITLLIIFIVISVVRLATLESKKEPQQLLDNEVTEFLRTLTVDYQLLDQPKDLTTVQEHYFKELAIGKKEGFTPILVALTPYVVQVLRYGLSSTESQRLEVIGRAATIDPLQFLSQRTEGAFSADMDDSSEIAKSDVEDEAATPITDFLGLLDYQTLEFRAPLLLLRLPTATPWEAPAWIPMGGFNDCPNPEEQIAVFRHWYYTYGAIPATASESEWELHVPSPITDRETVKKVAREQMGFCPDLALQVMDGPEGVKRNLPHSTVWYFWWD